MSEAQHEVQTAQARVEKNFRRMNFITLQGASEATFAGGCARETKAN